MSSPHSLMGSESPPSPDPDISPNAGKKGFGNFWSELRRRKVVRVAITYAIVAWLIMQVAGLTFEGFGVPIWAFRFVVIMVWLFFPVALIITWAFELTPDGIKTTKTARQERGGAPAPEDQQRKRNWFTVFFAAAIPTLIFGSLAIFFYIKAPRPETPEMVLAAPDTQESDMSIAVLPLGNLSPDPDNAFFAAGVHEDILTNLSKIKALRVISRTSTAGYKDTTKNLMEIGKELGVRYLVEGSVRRADNRVRVTVQLINARTDQHIWAENYDRTLEDIFAIQSAIATEIAEKLQAVISPEEVEQLEKLPTSNLEAYDFFLRFRQLQRDSDSVGPAGDEKIALLEKAVELDPEYAEAWAQLSIECVWWWAVGRNRSDPNMLAKGHRALAQAERLAPEAAFIPRAKSSFARFELQKPSEWERLIKEALAIDPNFTDAYHQLRDVAWMAKDYLSLQQYAEAELLLDPTSQWAMVDLAESFMYYQQWDQARDVLLKGLATDSQNGLLLEQLYFLEFLQFGDKERYLKKLRSAKISHIEFDISNACKIRDYDLALKFIANTDASEFIVGYYNSDILEPINMNAALIWFVRDNKEMMIKEAQVSMAFMEDVLLRDPRSKARYRNDMAICHAMLGELGEAQALMEEERQLLTPTNHARALFEIDWATIHLIAGDKEAAIAAVARAIEARPDLLFKREMDLYYLWDPLRGDPRFDALLK